MGIIVTIIVGFIVGLIARAIMPGNQSMGFIMTTILGIVGALAAGLVMQALGYSAREAEAALKSVPDGTDVAAGIRLALKALARP